MGGSGKTTLSIELFNRMKKNYDEACFLFDVRETSAKDKLPSLQNQLIKDLFNESAPNFQSIREGTSYISYRIQRSSLLSFLIILDDIDHVEQLEALLIRDLLDKSSNSLIIVTTCDVGVLISTGISNGYNLKGMHRNEARELFCRHAFEQPQPASGFEDIVDDFIDVCGGLPLSLQVLGRHVFRRDLAYWRLQVEEARKTMHKDVLERLKLSFDALNREEKEIFMDIACFFIDEDEHMAIKIWKACGWSAQRAFQTLKDKCLVTIGWRGFKMHDHLRDLGREIAREINAPRRPWRPQILKSLELQGFQAILSQRNVRCFQRILDRTMDAKITYFIGNSEEDWNETSASLLWLELDLQGHTHTNIPPWIPLQNLPSLRIRNGNLKRLWQTDVQTPSSLKWLQIKDIQLEELPDLSSNLLKKMLFNANMKMTIEGWSFLESLIMNPKSLFVHHSELYHYYEGELSLQLGLSNFKITGVLALNNRGQSHKVKFPMSSLKNLEIKGQDLVTKVLISGSHYPNFKYLHLGSMKNLTEVDLNMVSTLDSLSLGDCINLKRVSGDLTNLVNLYIIDCPELEQLPCLFPLRCLKSVYIYGCEKLNCLEFNGCTEVDLNMVSTLDSLRLSHCRDLKRVSGDLTKLVELQISGCSELEELPCLFRLSCLRSVNISGCEKLNCLQLYGCTNLRRVKLCDLPKLVIFSIRHCLQLEDLPEELPDLNGSSSVIARGITIDGCGKLDLLMLKDCKNLKSLSGDVDVAELEINGCPQLEELSSLARVENLSILPGIKHECSNAAIRNSILKLQRVPSEGLVVIGSAVDGAKTMLSPHLFPEWITREAVIKCNIDRDRFSVFASPETMPERGSWSAIIQVAVIASHRSGRVSVQIFGRHIYLNMGEWIVTAVCTDPELINNHFAFCAFSASGVIGDDPIIENAYMVTVKKSEEWETLSPINVVKIICDGLLKK